LFEVFVLFLKVEFLQGEFFLFLAVHVDVVVEFVDGVVVLLDFGFESFDLG
jgi:hypothetical protein